MALGDGTDQRAFEILGGLGILVTETGAADIAPVFRWGRLPLQAVLIWWLLWCTRPRAVRLEGLARGWPWEKGRAADGLRDDDPDNLDLV